MVCTILVIPFWNFTALYFRSYLPQVKRNLISFIINLVHEFLHEFPNDIRLRTANSRIGWRSSTQSALPEIKFWQKHSKNRYQSFLASFNLTEFLYPVLELKMLFQKEGVVVRCAVAKNVP